jgi:hypothetical protein
MSPASKVFDSSHVSSHFGANSIPAGILWALPSLKSSSRCFRSQKGAQARDARAPLRHPGVGTARFAPRPPQQLYAPGLAAANSSALGYSRSSSKLLLRLQTVLCSCCGEKEPYFWCHTQLCAFSGAAAMRNSSSLSLRRHPR